MVVVDGEKSGGVIYSDRERERKRETLATATRQKRALSAEDPMENPWPSG